MSNQEKQVIFITGATVGLGRLASKKCIDLGHTVIITGRSEQKIKDARDWILKDSPQCDSNLYGVLLDLNDLSSIKQAVKSFETFNLPAIDVLVHNAGGTLTEFKQVHGQFEQTVFMNAVAPLYLNELLMPYVQKSQHANRRILFVVSMLHDPTNVGGGGGPETRVPDSVEMKDLAGDKTTWHSMRFYKTSKLAVVWDVYALAERYPNIPIVAFCPGFVPSTDLVRNSSFVLKLALKYVISRFHFATSEEESTDDYVYYITTTSDIKSGEYYQKRKISASSKDSLDKTKREAYYELAIKTIHDLIQQ
jgi:NAD(P)-dependent dehydrogenase (short-subunit alcohol dehydrogenase family)